MIFGRQIYTYFKILIKFNYENLSIFKMIFINIKQMKIFINSIT